MLSYEWRELEALCDRISDLRHRYVAAQRSKNVGLIEGLKDDIARAKRQREMLVQHISSALSSAAAERPVTAPADPEPSEPAVPASSSDEPPHLLADAPASRTIYGFDD